MNIFVIGLNHKSAPIEWREKLYLRSSEREWLLSELRSDVRVIEAVVLSTCNRTEIYVNLLEGVGTEEVIRKLLKVKKVPMSPDLREHLYVYAQKEAVRHWFEVVTGLDSVVLGEKQILGQVKKAVQISNEMGMLDKTFHILTNLVIRAGKKVRHETDISSGGASVSWAAVTMAQQHFHDLRHKTALIIGAGKMGEMAFKQLRQAGTERIYIMNRTIERARDMARQHDGVAMGFWELPDIIGKVDLCVCSAGAPHYLLEEEMLANIGRDNPQLFIDISVPRNIHPAIGHLPGVDLVTVDDLSGLVEENIQKRAGAVGTVRQVIEEKIEALYNKLEKVTYYEQLNNTSTAQKARVETGGAMHVAY